MTLDEIAAKLKYPRQQRAALERTDPDSVSDPWKRAHLIAVKRNLEDAREMNAEVVDLFADSGIQDFMELPFIGIDYRAGLPIFEKWMRRIDNVAVVCTLSGIAIPYVNVVDESANTSLIECLVDTFVRISKFVKHPQLKAQIVANELKAFAECLMPSQANIIVSLCEDLSDDNALCVYLVSRLAKFKDYRAKPYLLKLLEDEEPWVQNVAIDCCRRLHANEFVPQLQIISESASDPKLRTKAAKAIVAVSKGVNASEQMSRSAEPL